MHKPNGLFDLRSLIQGRAPDMARTVLLVAIAVILASFCIWAIGALVGFGPDGIFARSLAAAAESPWAAPLTVAVFIAGSFIGAPQFLLIAMAVGAFGPWLGFCLAYGATLISATVNFWLARLFGARMLAARKSDALERLIETIGRNGFFSAMIVRIVPSAPFIVVNMALGLTRTPYTAFLAGTAVGIVPKTAIVALLGKVVERAMAGDADAVAYMIAAVIGWIVLALLARFLVARINGGATHEAPPIGVKPTDR
ncbi:MAG: VTT domain-containing protein [Pseudomonadota bacterium]